jgi:CHAT domain-containing protein/tetratricopeptide (TPR) repeat protein
MRATLVLLGMIALASASPTATQPPANPTREPTPREKAAQEVVTRYFDAVGKKDLDAMTAEWHTKSIHYGFHMLVTKKLFAATGPIEVKDLKLTYTKVRENTARVHVTVTLEGTATKTGKPHGSLGAQVRVLELTEVDGAWKITADALQDEYYTDLFTRRLKKDGERSEFLIAHREIAPTLAHTFNWRAYQLAAAGKFDDAFVLCDRASEVAAFLKSLEMDAWCRLHRGCVLEFQGKHAEALKEFDAGLAAFRREEIEEGEAAALAGRARVLVRLNRPKEAAAAFDEADRLFTTLPTTSYRTMIPGIAWANMNTAGRQWALEAETSQHRSNGKLDDALTSAGQLLQVSETLFGPVSPRAAGAHYWLGVLHAQSGDMAKAREAIGAAAKIYETLYGPGHDDTVELRVQIAWVDALAELTPDQRKRHWVSEGRLARALALDAKQRVLALTLVESAATARAELFGEDSYWAANAYGRRAALLAQGGRPEDFELAVTLYRRTTEIYSKVLGERHRYTRQYLGLWAKFLFDRGTAAELAGDYAKARDLYKAALAVRERLGDAADLADDLNTVKVYRWYSERADRVAGLPADRRAKARGATAVISLGVGSLLKAPNGVTDLTAAEADEQIKLLVEARDSAREVFGDADIVVVLGTVAVALLHTSQNRLDRAGEELTTVVRDLEHAGFETHSVYAMALNALAKLALYRNDLVATDRMIRDVIRKIEVAKGKDAHDAIAIRITLAMWYEKMGQTRQARDTWAEVARAYHRIIRGGGRANSRAVAIEFAQPLGGQVRPVDLAYAQAQAQVAEFSAVLGGDWAQAEAAYRQYMAIIARAHGPQSLEYAGALLKLSWGYLSHGRLDEADQLHAQVEAIYAARGKRDRALLAQLHDARADAALGRGEYAKAETLVRQHLALRREVEGPTFEPTNFTQFRLVIALKGQGKTAEAITEHLKLLAAEQKQFDQVFGFASESLMQQFVATGETNFHVLITLLAADPDRAELLWTWVLRRKGSVLDAECRLRAAEAALAGDPRMVARSQRLREVRWQLANLETRPPAGVSAEQLARDRKKLRDEEEQLEGELRRELTRLRPDALAAADEFTFARVRQKLPPGTALVEYVRYRPYLFKSIGNQRWGKERYLALVLPPGPNATPKVIDLGEAEKIDAAVGEWRGTMAEFRNVYQGGKVTPKVEARREKALNEKARELDAMLLKPLREHLGEAEALLLVPDGALHQLPFAALVDGEGKYLIESTRCGYLSSTRDLLRPPAAKAGDGVVVFAGPDFDLSNDDRWKAVQKLKGKPPTLLSARGPANAGTRLGWDLLKDARAEADDILAALKGGRFGPVEAVVEGDALEERLKAVRSPRILHIATHGFHFQRPKEFEPATGIETRLRQSDNPLLRSGLVLAGANRWRDKPPDGAVLDDGWLTADEVALLDLRGTELVVLSACEAGLGDIKSGEGVYGLRRAFLYAGARSVAVTLEQIPDAESRRLMRSFYEALAKGRSRADALREAQLKVIADRRKENQAAHPFFWGSFILVGDGG